MVFAMNVLFVKAQQLSVQFSQLSVQKGLSNNHINAILKDNKGYLWFATPSGLNRFDGKDITVFRHDSKDSTSLSDNTVNDLFMGPGDRIWIKTNSGFNIYDPKTETFNRNPDRLLKSDLPLAELVDIKSDDAGHFWFLFETQGLYRYDVLQKKIEKYASHHSGQRITGMTKGMDKSIWVVYEDGFLEQFHIESFKQLFFAPLEKKQRAALADYKIFYDKDGGIWIYAKNSPLGAYYFASGKKNALHLHTASAMAALNTNLVINITQDEKGRIWLATDHGGINLLDKNDFSVKYLVNKEFDDRSLAQNSITSLYKDRDGMIWVGTFKKGVSYFHDNLIKFPVYKHQPGNVSSLSYDDVNRFVEDSDGNIWIGTNGGGLIYFDRKNNDFKQYKNNSADPNSLSNNVIVSLCLDKKGDLWIGTYHGGLNKFDGKKFTHFTYNPNDVLSVSDNSIWELLEDSQGRLWVGTLSGGLNIMDRESGKFKRLDYSGENSTLSPYISAIMEDRAGNVWVGTANGVNVLEKHTGRFKHFGHQPSVKNSLSNDYITDIHQDSKGNIWIATRDGLNRYLVEEDAFHVYQKSDGLPDNIVLTILEDQEQTIWFSTTMGVSSLRYSDKKPLELLIKNFDSSDGLQFGAFNENAALLTRRGELVFGGPAGFNMIDPSTIKEFENKPLPIITDFQLFNKSVKIGEKVDGRIILDQSPAETKRITLSHNQNMFSIAFTSLDFLNKEHTGFLYKLEGFDDNWLQADPNINKATFTNLDPGTYQFKVKVSANNEVWSDEFTLLQIVVEPPFWLTPLAYLIYFIAFTSILVLIRHIEKQRENSRFLLRQEREEARRIRELDRMKTRFFTNVSHEFRTPLSLILAPLDKLVASAANEQERNHLSLIQRNAKRLLNLVNQLLDFRKIDMQALKQNPLPGDIIECIHQHAISFSDMAEKKKIDYSFKCNVTKFYTAFDHDKLERILFNLLSNAFKFTADGGFIAVDLHLNMNFETEEAHLLIHVQDSGIGIPEDKKDKIFNRYFQHDMPSELLNQGSGIGLAITKEYVKLAGGEISLESEANKGSCFKVSLPLHIMGSAVEETQTETIIPKQIVVSALPEQLADVLDNSLVKKQRILLVEDNEDFRFYLKDNLRELYVIEEAADAEAGWQRALASHPDLIVSDVNMPKGSGIDLCRKLKTDQRTTHIPVILLTAVAGESSQLQGLETGAADYIIKPFNFELLLSKIKSILKQRSSLEKTYKKQWEVNPSRIEVESADEKFLAMAIGIAEKHFSDSDFTIEFLANEMCMSRVSLYKRILMLTGHTPTQFVRNMRLKRAAQLLEESQLTVAEVAYEVGFNNPKQFSKYFKTVYNIVPSVYRNTHN